MLLLIVSWVSSPTNMTTRCCGSSNDVHVSFASSRTRTDCCIDERAWSLSMVRPYFSSTILQSSGFADSTYLWHPVNARTFGSGVHFMANDEPSTVTRLFRRCSSRFSFYLNRTRRGHHGKNHNSALSCPSGTRRKRQSTTTLVSPPSSLTSS